MSEEIKFTEEEMTSLQGLQQTYVGIQNAFGQVSVSKLRLDQQFEELEKADENLRTLKKLCKNSHSKWQCEESKDV